MFRIKRLVAKDCFAYRNLDFQFQEGIHSISGINGSSKTSIFMTLVQCFYNRNPKGLKIDEVSNQITCKPYEIECWADKDGKEVHIKNSKKTGKIEIYIDGVEKHVQRIPDNLKIIEEIVGCNFATFCDLVYQSPDSSINLLETNSDGERKKFINRVLRFDELDFHLDRMKQLEKELSGKSGEIAGLTKQIEFLEATIVEPPIVKEETPVDNLEKQQKELVTQIDSLKDSKAASWAKLKQQRELLKASEEQFDLTKKIDALNADLSGYPEPVDTSIWDKELQILRKQTQEAEVYASDLRGQLARGKQQEEAKKKAEIIRKGLSEMEVPEQSKEFAQEQLDKLSKLKTKTQSELSRVKEDLQATKKAIEAGVCPTCGQGAQESMFAEQIAEWSELQTKHTELIDKCYKSELKYQVMIDEHKNIEAITQRLAVVEASITEEINIENVQFNLDAAEGVIANNSKRIADITVALDTQRKRELIFNEIMLLESKLTGISYGNVAKELNELESEVSIQQLELIKAEEDLAAVTEELNLAIRLNADIRAKNALARQVEDSNQKIQLQLDTTKKELQEKEERLELIKAWVAILGPKGYRVHKIEKFLKSLNTTMLKYSEMIAQGKIKCTFFIDEDGEIDFRITDANKTISFAGWSAGEKARIKLACLFAVLELLEVIGSVSFNVLCLDEVWGSLDDEGKEGLFNVLTYLRHHGKGIYTIAHSEVTLPLTYDSLIFAEKIVDGTTEISQR